MRHIYTRGSAGSRFGSVLVRRGTFGNLGVGASGLTGVELALGRGIEYAVSSVGAGSAVGAGSLGAVVVTPRTVDSPPRAASTGSGGFSDCRTGQGTACANESDASSHAIVSAVAKIAALDAAAIRLCVNCFTGIVAVAITRQRRGHTSRAVDACSLVG